MDLLVQAASLNKLNPSGYSLVVLDSNQHVIHFKANQTVGQIGMYIWNKFFRKKTNSIKIKNPTVFSVKNCHLPQINGKLSICLYIVAYMCCLIYLLNHFKQSPNQIYFLSLGSSTISLLPKEPTHSTPSPKSKTQQQPFEVCKN